MEYKYLSWFIVGLCISLNIFGFYLLFAFSIGFIFFTIGILTIIYLHGGNADDFLKSAKTSVSIDNEPIGHSKMLGLNLGVDKKPIVLLTPNVREQTESRKNKHRGQSDSRKKNLFDSGIELFFKKNTKNVKDGLPNQQQQQQQQKQQHYKDCPNKFHTETANVPAERGPGDDSLKWKFLETIKIHTERRRSTDSKAEVKMAQECNDDDEIASMPMYKLHNDSAVLDQNGSPKKKFRTMLSGNKQIDHLLHTIIGYILRDFIDSWFMSLSDNKEFSEFRTRNCIEESVQNICARIKNTQWIPIITTKLVDQVALHARYYRLANETVNLSLDDTKQQKFQASTTRASPQRRIQVNRKLSQQHRRNKSDTDLNWYLGNQSMQRSVGNSKFYDGEPKTNSESDSESKLINAFFNQCDLYRDECLDETVLEEYLTHCMETVLYFTLPEEDFACIPLRMFLSTLLANVVCKPVIDMLAEPDFINLQIAKLVLKDPPNSEVFLRLVRQSSDLSELRACRQLITKEMDSKHRDPNAAAELNSLKYTQKLIDLRISFLQNNRKDSEHEKPMSNLPILTFDEILNKELALSYYLDYLSISNLQRYVIFYLLARDWRTTTARCLQELQVNKSKVVHESTMKNLREKAADIFQEYLAPGAANLLNIDAGLIETLNIRLNDSTFQPDVSWFESICKFIYEKIKNEEIFLNNFYQSSAYRKLLLELEFYNNINSDADLEPSIASNLSQNDTGSDSNSGDIQSDDEIDFVLDSYTAPTVSSSSIAAAAAAIAILPNLPTSQTTLSAKNNTHYHHHSSTSSPSATPKSNSKLLRPEALVATAVDIGLFPLADPTKLLTITSTKHCRSHSDCTGLIQNMPDLQIEPLSTIAAAHTEPKFSVSTTTIQKLAIENHSPIDTNITQYRQRLSAKIINTAINCDGQYAVYAIQVTIIEDNQQKSWHVYRRYSKFLELKKNLVKRYPSIGQVPFPAKKTFQNTQRSVLEHRMTLLNEFLKIICMRADDNDDLYTILRDFLEPDTNDKKIHGGAVIRTIETIVNPFKSGMRTIKNMPDTLVGGMAKILLGKGPTTKETAFLDVTPVHLEHSSEYPALTSALNLLDELFDLQSRSQWLRRGLINRLLGAPWVSQAANKRIAQAAKTVIEVDKIENLLTIVLNTIWPDGKRSSQSMPREENTKLRTQLAAKMALFSLLADDLKHVVGSETTRYGLLNAFSMWQHKTLNKRLILVLFNDLLKALYQTDTMTKHVDK